MVFSGGRLAPLLALDGCGEVALALIEQLVDERRGLDLYAVLLGFRELQGDVLGGERDHAVAPQLLQQRIWRKPAMVLPSTTLPVGPTVVMCWSSQKVSISCCTLTIPSFAGRAQRSSTC